MTIFSHRIYNSPSTIGRKCDILPSVPKEWGEFEITKSFRGSNLHIVIKNPGHIQSGCKKMVVNGIEVEGSYITQDMLTENTEIELMMS